MVYGDGTQRRDFIYVDDVIDQILTYFGYGICGVVDIGRGSPVRFIDIIGLINRALGTNIEPVFVSAPAGYFDQGVVCNRPGRTKTPLHLGIQKVLEAI